jgi:hypothetical protein
MITTNTTRSKAKDDDGKRRVVTTTTMKPGRVRFIQHDFPGVNKRETNKVDPKLRITTEALDRLMKTLGYKRAVKAEPAFAPAPAIKTPQPKPAKKAAPKKRKV